MRIVFIGTGEIGVPTLRRLFGSIHAVAGIITQPDKPVGRDQHIEAPPIKKAAGPSGIPILQPARIKNAEAIDWIRDLKPEVIVVVAYGQILPCDVLEIPTLACLNLHASLLPRWRGAAPIQAAIGAGDRETGMTVMYMDEGLDTGDILLQRKIAIVPNDTGGSLHDRLAEIAPEALIESLRLLAKGNAPRIQQDNSLATFAPKLKREDGKIDWSEPAETIQRKISAFNPWPGAYTRIGDRNLKIFSAAIVDAGGKPGDFVTRPGELVIAAGRQALSLGEVQLEGKRRMTAPEFLRGFDVASEACR